ncbi:hypothetical protein HK098_000567 [Nowakowskiella sp. JEL0407]|nr:hypothetical protein HK098_000567 [Nowakowskiella sp. JEL0407]
MYSQKRRHLPPGLNYTSVINTFNNPLLRGPNSKSITDLGANGNNGVFSELITNPDEVLAETKLEKNAISETLTNHSTSVAEQHFLPNARSFRRKNIAVTNTHLDSQKSSAFTNQLPTLRNNTQILTRTLDENQGDPEKYDTTLRNEEEMPPSGDKKLDQLPEEVNVIERRETDAKSRKRIDFSKAVEPKVLLPFEPRPGETPRKIEIERRKRFYSSQKIESLLSQYKESNKPTGNESLDVKGTEMISGFLCEKFSNMLPLQYFDDTEYDSRTVEDWLSMGHDASFDRSSQGELKLPTSKKDENHIRNAKIPVPSRAFLKGEWKNCIALAYDYRNEQWKIKCIKFDGWELERSEEEFEIYEDIDADAKNKSNLKYENERAENDHSVGEVDNEIWIKRYSFAVAETKLSDVYLKE